MNDRIGRGTLHYERTIMRNAMICYVFIGSLTLLGACGQSTTEEKDGRAGDKTGNAAGAGNNATSKTAAGKTIYESQCAGCHDSGVGGAPKIGNMAEWENRSARGLPDMIKNVINGMDGRKGSMPPKGGNPDLTDEEISSAVSYMHEKATGQETETDAPANDMY